MEKSDLTQELRSRIVAAVQPAITPLFGVVTNLGGVIVSAVALYINEPLLKMVVWFMWSGDLLLAIACLIVMKKPLGDNVADLGLLGAIIFIITGLIVGLITHPLVPFALTLVMMLYFAAIPITALWNVVTKDNQTDNKPS